MGDVMATPVMVSFNTVIGPPGLLPCSGAQAGDKLVVAVNIDPNNTANFGAIETGLFGRVIPADGFIVNIQGTAAAVPFVAIVMRG